MTSLAACATVASACLLGTYVPGQPDLRLVSAIDGVVSQTPVKAGDRVTKGQVLLRLDDRRARIDLQLAEKQVLLRRTELDAARANSKESQLRTDRRRRLFDIGCISSEEMQSILAANAKVHSEMAVKEILSQISPLEVERFRLQLEQHELRSPVDGIVEAIIVRPGEGVTAGAAVVRLRVIP